MSLLLEKVRHLTQNNLKSRLHQEVRITVCVQMLGLGKREENHGTNTYLRNTSNDTGPTSSTAS